MKSTKEKIVPTAQVSANIPTHVAIIMDGNGRWAKGKGVPLILGHREGAAALKRVARHAAGLGVKYLTVYAFSSENWRRPQEWIDDLMGLLRFYLKHEVKELVNNNIRLRVIGDVSRFSPDIQKLIAQTEDLTKTNTGLTLVIALNYGGRNDILQACRRLVNYLTQDYKTFSSLEENMATLNEEEFSSFLYTKEIPDPDLMIRSSGEYRISNFLLWQIAYSELVFSHKLWPDFNETDLDEAIGMYHSRDRRFGAVFAE